MSENPLPVATPPPPAEPGWTSWPVPAGVLGSAEGIQAALAALGFDGVVQRDGEVIRFSAARRTMGAAALGGALAGVVVYLVADRLGASPMVAVTVVTVAALLLPPLFVPTYTVAGRVEGGRIALQLRSRGLLARRDKLAMRLRFYLERPAPGRPPAR